MKHYDEWTYDMVRARIIEAADTLIANPAELGPRMASGSMSETLQAATDIYGKERTSSRRIPSAGALARMEETWTWINSMLVEDDRKLVYEYGFILTRKGLNIQGWCERNGWVKRTFERHVNRCCQQIADELNRKQQVRLTMDVDVVSQFGARHEAFEVASDSRAPVKHANYHRADGATPIHTPGTEAEIAHHIESVNTHRREDAERQRKEAIRRKEEEARLAAAVAKRQAGKQEAKRRRAA